MNDLFQKLIDDHQPVTTLDDAVQACVDQDHINMEWDSLNLVGLFDKLFGEGLGKALSEPAMLKAIQQSTDVDFGLFQPLLESVGAERIRFANRLNNRHYDPTRLKQPLMAHKYLTFNYPGQAETVYVEY